MDFGMIRSLAQAPPSQDAWEQLCMALDGLEEGRELERALGYLEGTLRRWPAELRVVPSFWRQEMLEKGKEAMRIARIGQLKQFSSYQLSAIERHDAEGMRYLERLEIVAFSGTMAELGVLLCMPGFEGLKTLELMSLTNRRTTGKGWASLRDTIAMRPQLRRLELRKNKLMKTAYYLTLFKQDMGLDALTIERSKLDEASLAGVVKQLGWGLSVLDLGGNDLGDEGWIALSRGDISGLRSLRLDRTRGGDAGAKALAARGLGRLEHLSMLNTSMGEVGFAALMGADLSSLRTLEVDLRGEHAGVGEALARAEGLEKLERATLRFNSSHDDGLCETIAGVEAFRGVRELTLGQVPPDGLATLLRSRAFQSVERLTLDMVEMTDGVWQALTSSEHLGRLTDLTISRAPGSDVREDGFGRFCLGEGVGALQYLTFSQCKWNVLERLANSPRIGMLTSLAVENSEFDEANLRRLFANEEAARMERFVIHPARVMTTEEAEACLGGTHYPVKWTPPFCALRANARADARAARERWRHWWQR